MKTVKILGKRYRLRWVNKLGKQRSRKRTVGDCMAPHDPGKTIRILNGLDAEETLDTIIHEVLHAADWHKTEEWVNTVASDLARILWKLGYRRTDVDE